MQVLQTSSASSVPLDLSSIYTKGLASPVIEAVRELDQGVWEDEQEHEWETNAFPLLASQLEKMEKGTSIGCGWTSYTFALPLQHPIDLGKLSMTWQAVASYNSALRTVIFQSESGAETFHQRIARRASPIAVGYREGQSMSLPYLVYHSNGAIEGHLHQSSLALHIHRALIDQSSLKLLRQDFEMFYNGYSLPSRVSFDEYVLSVQRSNQAAAIEYWERQLQTFRTKPLFHSPITPTGSRITTQAVGDRMLCETLRMVARKEAISEESLVQAAWSICFSHHCGMEDIVLNIFKRDTSIPGLDYTIGLVDQGIPIRFSVTEDMTAVQLAQTIADVGREAAQYGHLGGHRIKSYLNVPNILECRLQTFDAAGSKANDQRNIAGLDVQVFTEECMISVNHDAALLSCDIQVLLNHFWQTLDGVLRDPDIQVKDINMASEAEKELIMSLSKAPKTAVPTLVHQLVERQCLSVTDRPAIQYEGQPAMTYSEFNYLSNRVAHALHERIKYRQIVPVHMSPSTDLIVTLFAILKLGAAYVILDPGHPLQRKQYIVNDTKSSLCIARRHSTDDVSFAGSEVAIVYFEDLLENSQEETNLGVTVDVDEPAYIIYTSGTTGKPKGACLTHRAVSSGLLCAQDEPSFRSLLFYNPVFSAAQRTIWSTLAHGGCLCLASESSLLLSLADTIDALQVDNLGITSSTIKLLDPERVPTLKRITLTGELVDPDVVAKWADHVELRNNYGLTECTQLLWGEVLRSGQSNVHRLGRARDTTSAYILDPASDKLTPLLIPGELCLSGPQLASYYLNKPDLSHRSFRSSPFDHESRLYRTGDMAIRAADGSISIIGRIDLQTKINGQRVEPGEIQALLRQDSDVAAAVVVSATVDGRKALVACLTAGQTSTWPQLITRLRSLVVDKLPVYMRPTYWVQYPKISLNSNGKVDVRKLRDEIELMDHTELVGSSLVPIGGTAAEMTEAEKALQAAIAQVLDLPLELIRRSSSYLELGGDSLRAIDILSFLLQSGYSIQIRDIILMQSLEETAKLMKSESHTGSSFQAEPFSLIQGGLELDHEIYEDAFPATPLQEGVISAHVVGGNYVYDRVFQIEGVDINRLKEAFHTVIKQNSIYRTVFLPFRNTFTQAVVRDFHLPWENLPNTTLSSLQLTTAHFELGQPFLGLFLLKDNILVIRMHHALFDYWSSRFLFQDVTAAYLSKPVLHRPPFNSFVKFLQTQDQSEAQNFWKSSLDNAPQTLLIGRERAEFNICKQVAKHDLRALSSAAGITLGALIYSIWAILLWKHTGNQDVTFAVTLSGRDVAIQDVQKLNGPTLTTVPMRIHVDPSASLVTFIKMVQSELWRMAEFSQLGMRKALLAAGHKPGLFDTLVNFLVTTSGADSHDEVLKPYGPRPTWQTGYTSLEVEETRSGSFELRLSGELDPSRTLFILEQIENILDDLFNNKAIAIKDLHMVGPAETAYLQALATVTPLQPSLLHRSFEAIAALPRQTTCIDFMGEGTLSYRDLNMRANKLARYLQQQGIGPDSLVPICLSKSVEMVLCILAILKAGGAFVPLDPENPPERNNFIVTDVSAKLVLTDENYAPIFTPCDTTLVLDVYDLNFEDLSGANLEIEGLTSNNLAYAIYTSGSTGVPKGVLISHESINAGIESIVAAEGFDRSWRNLQFSNYVFDVAVGDIFCTFRVGATLCMASTDDILTDLPGVINRMDVTRLFLTPTVAKLINPRDVPKVQGLYLAGEQVTPDLVETWTRHCKVMNCYGPTESSILAVVGEIHVGGNARVIGYPLKHCSALILETESTNLAPYGAVGELCLGGFQLARGYLNQAGATEKAFITVRSDKIYRTGDLARWVPGGRIECFGRKDSQVKINGHRIEIGEIEHAILSTGLVSDTVVVVPDLNGKAQLVAYCVVNAKDDRQHVFESYESHRETLLALSLSLTSLAPYMVPTLWIPVTALPLLPSGKANRRELVRRAQEMDASELQRYTSAANRSTEVVEAETNEQKLLQSLWAGLFGVEPESISITSAFFAYGGDSISAINLVSKCRSLNYFLSVSDVLAFPILQNMATHLRPMSQREETPPPPVLDAPTLQQRLHDIGVGEIEAMWPCVPGVEEFLIRGDEREQFWQCQTVRPLPRDLDFELWTQATKDLTANNEILRSMWAQEGEQWVQIVLKEPLLDLEVVSCKSTAEKEAMIAQTWSENFNIQAGKPFIRYRLLEVPSAGERELLIKIHHAMYDGTLLRIFDDQFRAIHRRQPLPFSVRFANYVGYMFSKPEEKSKSLNFWLSLLGGSPAPYPPLPSMKAHASASETILRTADSRVNGFAAQCGVTVPIIFQSVFTLLLSKLSGSNDVVYDNLITGRNIEMENAQVIAGNCANFLPFRSVLEPATTVEDFLKATQQLFWKTTEFGNVNTSQIRNALGWDKHTTANRALFLFQPFEPVAGAVKHMRWMAMAGSRIQMPIDYALHLEVSKTALGYNLKFRYDATFYKVEEAQSISDLALHILDRIIAQPWLALSALNLHA